MVSVLLWGLLCVCFEEANEVGGFFKTNGEGNFRNVVRSIEQHFFGFQQHFLIDDFFGRFAGQILDYFIQGVCGYEHFFGIITNLFIGNEKIVYQIFEFENQGLFFAGQYALRRKFFLDSLDFVQQCQHQCLQYLLPVGTWSMVFFVQFFEIFQNILDCRRRKRNNIAVGKIKKRKIRLKRTRVKN